MPKSSLRLIQRSADIIADWYVCDDCGDGFWFAHDDPRIAGYATPRLPSVCPFCGKGYEPNARKRAARRVEELAYA